MSEQTVRVGRSIDWLAENALDGKALRIIALMDLHNALYGVEKEFEYDDTEEAQQLLREIKGLTMTVDQLSLTDDAELTFYRECSRSVELNAEDARLFVYGHRGEDGSLRVQRATTEVKSAIADALTEDARR